jgi:HEAT repeat protein
MKNDPVQSALAGLDDTPLHTPEGSKQIAKALASKSNLVAAKAARIAGDAQWTELTDELVAAFDRFLKRGSELDKGCVALNAFARALYNLDYDGGEFFLTGLRHVQMEPSWGGSSDTAIELRGVCAMALASTTYPNKLHELVNLLVDPEWQARAGAVRAIAAVGSDAAMLLLRFKALSGDKEPEVISDCFSGLLAVEGADALPLVQSYANGRNREVREAAILALGASRRADAVEWLVERFEGVAHLETRQCILLALATSRTDAAIEFLLGVIRHGSAQTSTIAVQRWKLIEQIDGYKTKSKRRCGREPAVLPEYSWEIRTQAKGVLRNLAERPSACALSEGKPSPSSTRRAPPTLPRCAVGG